MRGLGLYVLIGRLPVSEHDPLVWSDAMADDNRQVGETLIFGIRVSTVFIGIDCNIWPDSDPLLFETMIFADLGEHYQTRCATWAEAEHMHDCAVSLVEKWVSNADISLWTGAKQDQQNKQN
jgi:hypothetical protein